MKGRWVGQVRPSRWQQTKLLDSGRSCDENTICALHHILPVGCEQKSSALFILKPAKNDTWYQTQGGTLGISGWGCAARTLEPLAYTRASFSWILLPYTRVNSPNGFLSR